MKFKTKKELHIFLIANLLIGVIFFLAGIMF